MPPPKLFHFQNPSWPTHFHRFSCANPNRPPLEQPPITATSRRTSMPLSSSLLLPASCLQQTPINRPPPFPQPAALSPPHHPIPHQLYQQTTTRSMAIRQPHSHSHRHPAGTAIHSSDISLPHRRHTAQQTLQNTSSHHHPHPHPAAGSTHQHSTPAINRQSTATVHPLPKRPPPSLYQAQQPHATTEPLQPVPRQPAGRASKADLIRLHHQWHRRQPYPHPRTRGQHIATFQHNNPPPSSPHKPVPQTWVHHPPWSCSTPPRQGWTRRGAPCHCLTRTMTPLRTHGTRTTSDHVAAASEVPTMIYPGMIHTTTTSSHTLFVVFRVCAWF